MNYTLEKTDMYLDWLDEQTKKIQVQIQDRLDRIVENDHFGNAKNLGDNLSELKFNNGTRIYFAIISHKNKIIILLLGGNKNGQNKDIKKAKSLYSQRYARS